MKPIKSYKELIVWQKSMKLVREIFILTALFPKSEIYGIISQMRRAVVSIPSNIAGGFGRRSLAESSQFHSITYGPALELETQLIIAKELKLAKGDYFKVTENLLLEVCKMLNVMTGKLRRLKLVSNT